ncbi:MAG: ergothioneine biosynthesis protein EgtB [Acidimicrobiia bacterium]|nr:ergothioneine biosynthesis protein EgtB [Acidimicrobiia bacterium]
MCCSGGGLGREAPVTITARDTTATTLPSADPTTATEVPVDLPSLGTRLEATRRLTEQLAEPLSPEDQTAQSMADVSPTKWHRAHTTWFFETFVLATFVADYVPHHPEFGYLFNSYYEQVGPRHPRAARGVITRPGAAEVGAYRRHVDAALAEAIDDGLPPRALELVELGIHHEQQHQELLLMDIKHVLSCNALDPCYLALDHSPAVDINGSVPAGQAGGSPGWEPFAEGLVEIGQPTDPATGFCFDNERPRHPVHLRAYELADRLLNVDEVLAFIDDGGYHRPELWLSDGWATVCTEGWQHPLYWQHDDNGWAVFTLGGRRPLRADEPVVHLSYYEADAIARWAGARLPTEAEWEHAAAAESFDTGLLDLEVLHPRPPTPRRTNGAAGSGAAGSGDGCRQLSGEVWEWTASPYVSYPGFEVAPGAVGEYNGKFMVNQHVLRGGSCVTPPGHVRATYRNFFPPSARWAFSGCRLARDLR